MKGEKYVWATVVMVFIGIVTIMGYSFLQELETKAFSSPSTAGQYNTLKYATMITGAGVDVLVLFWMLKTKLAGRPKPKLLKVGIVEPSRKGKVLRVRAVEPGKGGGRRIKVSVVEKPEPKRIKLRAVELTPEEKERRIKGIIDTLWKKRGEASMDEIVGEAAKHGIDKRDVEKFLESEKKRGRLKMEKS